MKTRNVFERFCQRVSNLFSPAPLASPCALTPQRPNFFPAFTLIEVNLAMLIMAGGILSVVGLYAFGFRENRQGREDVAAAAYADAVLSPLILAISSTNVTWTNFRQPFFYPNENGWKDYFDSKGIVSTDPDSKGQGAYPAVRGWLGNIGSDLDLEFPTGARPKMPEMSCAVVVMHAEDSAIATIGFRAVDSGNYRTLLGMPIFFTQVRFQGKTE